MAKNRKEHAKQQRLNGMRQKRIQKERAEHARNLQTLQQALDHSARLQEENPELFASVTDTVKALAAEAKISVETLMKEGVTVVSDDGHTQVKKPQQIIDDIRISHSTIQRAMTLGSRPNIQPPANNTFNRRGAVVLESSKPDLNITVAGEMFVEDAPSLARQREAAAALNKGIASLRERDMTTLTDGELQDAMACGYEPATTEWLRRNPEPEPAFRQFTDAFDHGDA